MSIPSIGLFRYGIAASESRRAVVRLWCGGGMVEVQCFGLEAWADTSGYVSPFGTPGSFDVSLDAWKLPEHGIAFRLCIGAFSCGLNWQWAVAS